MKKLGITGGIAMGKSTVLEIIRGRGIEVFSCDAAAREVYDWPPVVKFLRSYRQYRAPGTRLTRDRVRAWMLEDAVFKRGLEDVMFPLIVAKMQFSSAQVVEAPLLYEAGLQDHFEQVWCIYCSPETQMKRLVERVGDSDVARRLVSAQMPIEDKARYANYMISTDCSLDDLAAKVTILLKMVFA